MSVNLRDASDLRNDNDEDFDYRPPRGPPRRQLHRDDPDPFSSDDDDTNWRRGRRDGNRRSYRDRLTDESTTLTKENIHKIPSQVLVKFNADEGASSRYCDNLRRLCSNWYGEASVMLTVSATLEGRALDWFESNVWPLEAMRSVEAWIECLQEEFAIDTAKARKEANACTYDPT